MSRQLNVRTTKTLLLEIDRLVEKGIFRTRTEAVNEGLRMVVRRYRMADLREILAEEEKEESLMEEMLDVHGENGFLGPDGITNGKA